MLLTHSAHRFYTKKATRMQMKINFSVAKSSSMADSQEKRICSSYTPLTCQFQRLDMKLVSELSADDARAYLVAREQSDADAADVRNSIAREFGVLKYA